MANRLPRSHRIRVENEMIKKREKQFLHEQTWNTRKQYYESWDRKNTKYDEWTSPRYHETNNKLVEKIKKQREHEENLTKRREKLTKLLNEEEQLYQVELMIHKTKKASFVRTPRSDEIPVEVLKELNHGLKVEEEDRRRHEAELKLYHQWRNSNPILKHCERIQKNRDLKLSWLDQQIENRMKKEREEEECRKLLKEREKMLKEEQERFEEEQKILQQKKDELKSNLDQQIEEMKKKSLEAEELRKNEDEENRKRLELEKLELLRIEEEKRRLDRECALYNMKHYKMRLKKKAENIEADLDEERRLISSLNDLKIVDRIQNEAKKDEIKEAINQFLSLNEQQKKLEKTRQKHLDFLFDSEAKAQFEQQNEFWQQEEVARKKLIEDVLQTVKRQIELNLERNKQKQIEVLREREDIMRRLEEYKREMDELRQNEERKKIERRKMIDDDVKMKSLRKKARENVELKKIDEELERVRKEEERLKQEILNMQRRQGPIRPTRSKLFF